MSNICDFKEKLCRARNEKGLSREELADRVGYTKYCIDKWEQGKRTPGFLDVVSLSRILEKPLGYFAEGDIAMLTSNQLIINENTSKPLVVYGAKDTLCAYKAYYNDFDVICRLDETTEVMAEWKELNTFTVLINHDTKEICGIRDFGMYLPEAANYLFKTSLIPLRTNQPAESEEELTSIAEETLQLLDNEIAAMKSCSDYPVFLLKYCGTNNYTAWSIAENKEIYIFDYKEYLQEFFYSDTNIKSLDEVKKNDKYTILPPSKKIIDAIGLELYPNIWENKMAWDEWAPRKERDNKSHLIPEECKDIYNKAIYAINLSRTKDLKCDNVFAALETRVTRLEHLCELGAPADILGDEINLVRKGYQLLQESNVLFIKDTNNETNSSR